MGFFSKLLGKDDWKKTLVRDLVLLTAIDGEMDKDEIKLVLNIAINELDFTEKKFINLMQNLGDVEDIYPTSEKDKFEYMLALIRMTYSDGYIDDNELKLMRIIASKMNLPKDGVDKAIAFIEKELV